MLVKEAVRCERHRAGNENGSNDNFHSSTVKFRLLESTTSLTSRLTILRSVILVTSAMIETGDHRTQTYMLIVSPLFQLRPPVHRIVVAELATEGRVQYC